MSLLEMTGISKRFPGVIALDGVDLTVNGGEVHVLLGENGAGKSTLMKILSGAHRMDSGTIRIRGESVTIRNPRHAQQLGVGIIYQELTLVPELSAADNIYLGREPRRGFGIVDRERTARDAQRLLDSLGLSIDARRRTRDLSLAERQLVEIAKALSLDPEILVMDEPTSALTERETQRLFDVLRTLTASGVAIIYISHRLDEIFQIGNRVTVLRDGKTIATHALDGVNREELVRQMANREITETIVRTVSTRGDELLRVTGLTRAGVFNDVSFAVHAGEVLGLAGLMGAGRTEIARAIFGLDQPVVGEIAVRGQPARISSPRDAIALGIGFVTEDRKAQGLVLGGSVRDNIVLPMLRALNRLGVVRIRDEQKLADGYIHDLRIKTPSPAQQAVTLSGGNQQKIVLAKWLAADTRILFLDEPTRGIDVGAKQEIYKLINRLTASGMGVVLISSELPEIVGLSDRVLVIREGRVAGEFTRGQMTQANILACAVGAAA